MKAFDLAGSVRLLGNLSWPISEEEEFLAQLRKGNFKIPSIQYPKVDYKEQKTSLQRLLKLFSAQDPLEIFTKQTIQSYIDAVDLNHAIGTDSFTEISKKVFGVPGDRLLGSEATNIDAAEKLVKLSEDFNHEYVKEPEICILADEIKSYLERRIQGAFKGEGPEVIITPEMAAKATATARRIKLRSGTSFSSYDFKQLFYHEVMTHSLTSLNGETQPILKCLGRGAMRTLKTQEGLATFSEVVTGSMDIKRLNRLAPRVLAIDMALKGASFVEVFRFFQSKNVSDKESYAATQRIFRGGYPEKNIVFTKDGIYLDGLMYIHTLFRWAMKENKLEYTHLLFCGRLSVEDIFELDVPFRQGQIAHPKFLPGWYQKIEGLAGSLGFSLLANLVRINLVDHHFKKSA